MPYLTQQNLERANYLFALGGKKGKDFTGRPWITLAFRCCCAGYHYDLLGTTYNLDFKVFRYSYELEPTALLGRSLPALFIYCLLPTIPLSPPEYLYLFPISLFWNRLIGTASNNPSLRSTGFSNLTLTFLLPLVDGVLPNPLIYYNSILRTRVYYVFPLLPYVHAISILYSVPHPTFVNGVIP